MARRFLWISTAAVLAMTALAQPWHGGAAEARPAPRPAACRADDVVKLKAELAAAQAEVARLQGVNQQFIDRDKARAKKLADQLGSPMIETLNP